MNDIPPEMHLPRIRKTIDGIIRLLWAAVVFGVCLGILRQMQ